MFLTEFPKSICIGGPPLNRSFFYSSPKDPRTQRPIPDGRFLRPNWHDLSPHSL